MSDGLGVCTPNTTIYFSVVRLYLIAPNPIFNSGIPAYQPHKVVRIKNIHGGFGITCHTSSECEVLAALESPYLHTCTPPNTQHYLIKNGS